MAGNGAGRSVSHNTFGDYAQIIQGDYNVSNTAAHYYPWSLVSAFANALPAHPPKKALELDYLHEATFNANSKQHAPNCLENAQLQFLGKARSWIDGDGEKHIYWLRGIAGTGKTTISIPITREYHRKGRLGASFFFSTRSGDILRSLRQRSQTNLQKLLN
ncbi:hypothetical protein J3E69DRAFT_319399 [Trichoderma sp. SZMC 28015]